MGPSHSSQHLPSLSVWPRRVRRWHVFWVALYVPLFANIIIIEFQEHYYVRAKQYLYNCDGNRPS